MSATPASLLERLRQPADQDSWSRFVQLYTPLLYHWALHLGRSPDDAADLVQDVFVTLVQKLPDFSYDARRTFRGWLWTVLLNKFREHRRHRATEPLLTSRGLPPDVPSPDTTDLLTEEEYRQYLTGRALQVMRAEFQPTTWRACWEHLVSGRSAAEIAADLGISEGAVYVAKHRVLRRLRQELEGLFD